MPGPEPLKTDDVLTTGKIAALCRVDVRTVNRWIDRGILKAHMLPVTGFRRVQVDDFIAFLHEQGMPLPPPLRLLGRKRVLIVDDDRDIRREIGWLFAEETEGQEAYEVAFAEDGFEAGAMVQKFKPHAIILDLKMPRMDGFEVCRRLKADADTKSIKILAISGGVDEEDRRKILALGADEFLKKPVEAQALKSGVADLLKRPSAV